MSVDRLRISIVTDTGTSETDISRQIGLDSKGLIFVVNNRLGRLRRDHIKFKNDLIRQVTDYKEYHKNMAKAIMVGIEKFGSSKIQQREKWKWGGILFKKVSEERNLLKKKIRRSSLELNKSNRIKLETDKQLTRLHQGIFKYLNESLDEYVVETKNIRDKLDSILIKSDDDKGKRKAEFRQLQRNVNLLKLLIVEYQQQQYNMNNTAPFSILDSLIDKMKQMDDLEHIYKSKI